MGKSSPSDTFSEARNRLVDGFSAGPHAIRDSRVLAAMRATPRHEFVPEDLRSQAYVDGPLPIGYGQTISQPSLVAFMTEQMRPQSTDRILEIGTGSGYQAAVLSPLVAEVFSIEIVESLAERARETLARLGCGNVHLRSGDGHGGWPEAAPFDAIIVTCAPEAVPRPLIQQLRDGGRLIVPVGSQQETQELFVMEKRGGAIERRAILPVRFVPMTGLAEA